jgi:3-oxoacyl-[acyl-carrier-protein] synthase III
LAELKTDHYCISAIYSCVPKEVIYTSDYEWISPEERKLFSKTTGIIRRHVARTEVTCSDLCFKAADALLRDMNVREQIDLVLFVSQSPDYFLPATSIILQNRLGIPKTAMAFDVNLGCSGYVYGLSIAASFLKNEGINNVLLLAGDKSTISTSSKDKSTFPLFGDAGTATLIQKNGDDSKKWCFNMFSDGSGADAIKIECGHSRNPYTPGRQADYKFFESGIERTDMHLALDGLKVFNFALKEVAASIKSLLTHAHLDIEQIDYLLLHQANLLINESIRKKLKMAPEKCPNSINEFGNTSSASIPLTMCHQLDNLWSSGSKRILMSGFGVGLSWANLTLEMEKPLFKLLDYD